MEGMEFGRLVSSLRKRRGLSVLELAVRCGLGKNQIEAITQGRRQPSTLIALRLLRVLKPRPSEMAVFLSGAGLLPVFGELEMLAHENGIFNALTAETGVACARNLKWMMKTRIATEYEAIYFLANLKSDGDIAKLGEFLADNREGCCARTMSEWQEALNELAVDHVDHEESHRHFHLGLIDIATELGGISNPVKGQYYAIMSALMEFSGQIGAVIQFANLPTLLQQHLHMYSREDDIESFRLHQELLSALASGEGERAKLLFELHWSWALIDTDQRESMIRRALGQNRGRGRNGD
jgi:transcriptional regulator with XRE-family HTH domain